MSAYPGWPYTIKPVIQHEFSIDHLNIWITFQNKMDILGKPAIDKWTIYCDAVEKTAVSQVWEDHYTLLIEVSGIVSLPDRVLVKYEDPDFGLRTAEHKQWDRFGPVLSLDITTTSRHNSSNPPNTK